MAQLIHAEQATSDTASTIAQMCRPAQITRAQFYHHRPACNAAASNMEYTKRSKLSASRCPLTVSPDTAHLRRNGRVLNGKTVLRSMRYQNLLCKRRRFVRTTNSFHVHHVYPNPAREMKVANINKLWVGHYLSTNDPGLCLSGSHSRCLQPPRGRLGNQSLP